MIVFLAALAFLAVKLFFSFAPSASFAMRLLLVS